MPEFAERNAERERRKAEELAPYIEKALARKQWMKPLTDDEIPEIPALGRQVVQQMPADERKGTFQSGSGLSVPLSDPLAK
jgi:hypothetical protein